MEFEIWKLWFCCFSHCMRWLTIWSRFSSFCLVLCHSAIRIVFCSFFNLSWGQLVNTPKNRYCSIIKKTTFNCLWIWEGMWLGFMNLIVALFYYVIAKVWMKLGCCVESWNLSCFGLLVTCFCLTITVFLKGLYLGIFIFYLDNFAGNIWT